MKSCPTPCLGSLLHVHAKWVIPSPVPGGAIGQSLEGGLLLNIRKLFTKQALERSGQNSFTKFNYVTHFACDLYYTSMPKGLPQTRSHGRYRPKPEGKCTLEYYHVCHQVGNRIQ